MSALVNRVILSWGWERRLIAFVAGALGVFALQPFGFAPAFFVPMTVAVWLLDGCAGKRGGGRGWASDLAQAAELGWWLGFGYFLAGLWWIGSALLVDADQFAWALPFATIGLPAVLACFMGLGFAIARALWSAGPARILALAAGLGASEWLRGHLFTGFPWNALGMALGAPVLAQTASIYGLYGLSVIAVALFAAPALLTHEFGATRSGARGLVGPAVAILAWAALIGFGVFRLTHATVHFVPGVRIRVMQPNVAQDQKFRPENGEAILARYLSLSDRATSPSSQGLPDVTHLIWPESAFPFILSRTPAAMSVIARALPPRTTLITGAARAADGPKPGETWFFNSIEVISGGAILDNYDKTHLVPFGEYLPFQETLERLGLRDIVELPGGFRPGRRHKLLEAPGLPPILPLICYEAIFPIEWHAFAQPGVRPGLLLNVTNDGWFGGTIGPYQHFAQSRMRAIEEGLPLIRAANTGISAVVDPYGRVLTELPLGVADVLDASLPQRIAPPLFAQFPIATEFSLWLLALIGSFFSRRWR